MVLSVDQREAKAVALARLADLIDRLAVEPGTLGFEVEIRPPHNGQLLLMIRETQSIKLAFRGD